MGRTRSEFELVYMMPKVDQNDEPDCLVANKKSQTVCIVPYTCPLVQAILDDE